jgi:hypothetical protein
MLARPSWRTLARRWRHPIIDTVSHSSLCSLRSLQIGSHVNDMTLADPALFPIFKEAEKLGACIFVHPWDMVSSPLTKKYWLPWFVPHAPLTHLGSFARHF